MPIVSHSSWGVKAATLLMVGVAVLAACGKREASEPQGMGPLTPFLDIGTRGMWTGVLKDNVYSLSNTQEPRALRTITLLRTEDPRFSVSVDIKFATQTDDCGAVTSECGVAGLVFSHNAEQKHYYLLALRPDGDLKLYNRSAAELTIALQSLVKLKSGFNRLSFEGEGNTVVIKVNGVKIELGEGYKAGEYAAQGLGEGGAGIAALGVGSFSFTNFETTGYRREPIQPAAADGSKAPN